MAQPRMHAEAAVRPGRLSGGRILALALAGLLAIPQPLVAQSTGEPPLRSPGQAVDKRPRAAVEGFRSARFGMSEEEVRQAVRRDFGEVPIRSHANPAEGTKVLTANVDLGEPGRAQLAYIFGATGGKLIHVNVLWSTALDPATDSRRLAGLAAALRNHFAGRAAYAPGSVLMNTPMEDGALIAFQGADDRGRLLRLRFIATRLEEASPPAEEAALMLSYVEDPARPDVLRPEKQQ